MGSSVCVEAFTMLVVSCCYCYLLLLLFGVMHGGPQVLPHEWGSWGMPQNLVALRGSRCWVWRRWGWGHHSPHEKGWGWALQMQQQGLALQGLPSPLLLQVVPLPHQ